MRRSILLATGLVAALTIAACGGNSGSTPTTTPVPTPSPTAKATPKPTPATVAVPNVVGDAEADALVAFGAAGLKAGEKTRKYDSTMPSGDVLSTNPKGGVVVQVGTPVDYLVSRGPSPTPSPSPKPTVKPTPKTTPKPTAAPTAKPTPKPTPTPAPVALPGTSWTLTSYVDSDSTSFPVPESITITAVFTATEISGSAGCNSYTAPYVATSGTISIGTIATSTRSCADDVNAAEAAYLDALEHAGSFSATTAKLKIGSTSATTRLVYVPGASAR